MIQQPRLKSYYARNEPKKIKGNGLEILPSCFLRSLGFSSCSALFIVIVYYRRCHRRCHHYHHYISFTLFFSSFRLGSRERGREGLDSGRRLLLFFDQRAHHGLHRNTMRLGYRAVLNRLIPCRHCTGHGPRDGPDYFQVGHFVRTNSDASEASCSE